VIQYVDATTNEKSFFSSLLDCNPLTAFVIGKSQTIAVIDTGVLTCFANDVAFMYWNNSGNLNLQITRVL